MLHLAFGLEAVPRCVGVSKLVSPVSLRRCGRFVR